MGLPTGWPGAPGHYGNSASRSSNEMKRQVLKVLRSNTNLLFVPFRYYTPASLRARSSLRPLIASEVEVFPIGPSVALNWKAEFKKGNCLAARRTFKRHFRLAPQKRQAEMNVLPIEKQAQILNSLVEGCPVRSTAHLVRVGHKTGQRVTDMYPWICSPPGNALP